MHPLICFLIAWVVSMLGFGGIFLFTEWETLYPSFVLYSFGDYCIVGVIACIPALFITLVYVAVADL